MPEPADTGRRIKELRASAGMTQQELAGSDLSASYLSLVERGKRIPSGRALTILAERLGVGVAEISGDAEPPEATARVRRQDLVGRLVAARRQWEGGDPEGALREFRSLAGTEPAGRPDDVHTEARLASAEILGALGRADEGVAVLRRLLDRLAPGAYPEARLRVLIALADLLESAGRVQDGLRYALTGSVEAAAAQAPGSAFHALLVLDVLTRCAYWSGCAQWAPAGEAGELPVDGALPGPRARIELHRALDLWDRGESDRAAGLLAETARRVTPAAGFRLWEAVNGRHALLLLGRGERTAARSIVERGLVVASVAREPDFPLWLTTAQAACAAAAGDRDRVGAVGAELAALPDTGRCHEKAAALAEIAAGWARLGDREKAAGNFRYSAELFRRAQAYRHADRVRERLAGLLDKPMEPSRRHRVPHAATAT